MQLVAIGKLFKDRLDGGIANLKQKAPQQFEKKSKVDPDHMFLGSDAYKKVPPPVPVPGEYKFV